MRDIKRDRLRADPLTRSVSWARWHFTITLSSLSKTLSPVIAKWRDAFFIIFINNKDLIFADKLLELAELFCTREEH